MMKLNDDLIREGFQVCHKNIEDLSEWHNKACEANVKMFQKINDLCELNRQLATRLDALENWRKNDAMA